MIPVLREPVFSVLVVDASSGNKLLCSVTMGNENGQWRFRYNTELCDELYNDIDIADDVKLRRL